MVDRSVGQPFVAVSSLDGSQLSKGCGHGREGHLADLLGFRGADQAKQLGRRLARVSLTTPSGDEIGAPVLDMIREGLAFALGPTVLSRVRHSGLDGAESGFDFTGDPLRDTLVRSGLDRLLFSVLVSESHEVSTAAFLYAGHGSSPGDVWG
jgi:hypothetical protein